MTRNGKHGKKGGETIMKKDVIIGIMAVVLLALATSSALALGPGYGHGAWYGPGYYGYPVSNLTPEQTTKIAAIQQAHLKEVTPLRQQLLAKKAELRTAWLTQNPDQARINTLQKDVLDLQGKLQEKTTNARFETKKVLTPEQQAQLTLYGPGMGYRKGMMGRW